MSELLELVFAAPDAIHAAQMARDWAAAEPGIRLERVTRVRPWKHPTEEARLAARRRTQRESWQRRKAATA